METFLTSNQMKTDAREEASMQVVDNKLGPS